MKKLVKLLSILQLTKEHHSQAISPLALVFTSFQALQNINTPLQSSDIFFHEKLKKLVELSTSES